MTTENGEIKLLNHRLTEAERHIRKQDGEIDGLRDHLAQLRVEIKVDEEARERKRLVWGITALGAVVMTLGGIIWQYRGIIFK